MMIGQKILDFLPMTRFWMCLIFFDPDFSATHQFPNSAVFQIMQFLFNVVLLYHGFLSSAFFHIASYIYWMVLKSSCKADLIVFPITGFLSASCKLAAPCSNVGGRWEVADELFWNQVHCAIHWSLVLSKIFQCVLA